ncbi:MPCP-like protein [Mya arenaria]|uniref:MPCP-like protein n=1 Tax=Mya arenaria TaxID=6604 RepID=A0ABY7G0X0_MYAAR|nr:MPCP-like protein [Mya arenaria]
MYFTSFRNVQSKLATTGLFHFARQNTKGGKMTDNTVTPTAHGPISNLFARRLQCAGGAKGILSCGITHTAVVPLDLVKCRIQVDPAKYGNIINGFKVTIAEGGVRGLGLGWAPTLIGYSMQGLCKFGFYEVFKNLYSNLLGEEKTFLWRTSLYLAASASAEFFADIALCPMESVKVRMQTKPGFSKTLREGFPKIKGEEGWNGGPSRPCTSLLCPNPAGVFCAIVSHPADTIVSKLNNDAGSNFVDAAKSLGLKDPPLGSYSWSTAQWFIYDSVKVAFRLPRPPPPEMPESLKKKLGVN